jgi:hypothetical protein
VSKDIVLTAISFGGTLLLVLIGLLNFSVFLRQLRAARDQIDTSLRQLELAQKLPEIQLIQRAIAETSEHVRLLVERPYLRPYFYADQVWSPDDRAGEDEVKAMAELILNNFASALMHSAAFPQYPVGSVDQTIKFHLRHSPSLRDFLFDGFARFPITGMSLLCLKNTTSAEIEADLRRLIAAAERDSFEQMRREQLLQLFQRTEPKGALAFTRYNLEKARGQLGEGSLVF